jgi:hypothetical protein
MIALVGGNLTEIEDNRDAHAFMAEIKEATPENWLQKIQTSETKIGRGIATVLTEVSESQTVLVELDDDRFAEALSPKTLRNPEKISELLEMAKQKRLAAEQAPDKIEHIYQSVFAKKETLSSKMSISMSKPFWDGLLKGYNEQKPSTASFAKAYFDFYDNIIGMYAILLEQAGSYSVSDKSFVTFQNEKVIEAYNNYLSRLMDASDRIGKAAQNAVHKNEDALSKIQREH